MRFVPGIYLEVLRQKSFLILILTLLVGQIGTAFLLLSLVSSVFTLTHNNFGVSGVVLSLAVPAFFLMAFAGILADLFDRRKIIIGANFLLTVVVLFILLMNKHVLITIGLSFLYFGVNSFFIPAVSAASAQLVKKEQLLIANSLFIFTLYGGVIVGAFFAAISNFFFGHIVTLIICELLLITAVVVPFFLPKLSSTIKGSISVSSAIKEIWLGFIYTFQFKVIWFFFVVFALSQGIIAFGTTLTPGFFDEVVGLPINESPLFILPLVGLGITLGAIFAYKPKLPESFLAALGVGIIGAGALSLGLSIASSVFRPIMVVALVATFTVLCGFGTIVTMVASRTVLQKKVSHELQGTVFGANTVLATVFAGILSPLAALLDVFMGYVNILILGGVVFIVTSGFIGYFGRRWKF